MEKLLFVSPCVCVFLYILIYLKTRVLDIILIFELIGHYFTIAIAIRLCQYVYIFNVFVG